MSKIWLGSHSSFSGACAGEWALPLFGLPASAHAVCDGQHAGLATKFALVINGYVSRDAVRYSVRERLDGQDLPLKHPNSG